MRVRGLTGSFLFGVLAVGAHAQNVTVVYPPPQSQPDVVVLRERAVPAPDKEYAARQTAYLIAFKNSVVRQADFYWVNGNTFYYVTTDHRQMSAPLYSVDRTLSERLNAEQDLAFVLPPGQGKPIVQGHAARSATSALRKACCCASGSSASRSSSVTGGASRVSPPRPRDK
jgi:hypothetical protein